MALQRFLSEQNVRDDRSHLYTAEGDARFHTPPASARYVTGSNKFRGGQFDRQGPSSSLRVSQKSPSREIKGPWSLRIIRSPGVVALEEATTLVTSLKQERTRVSAMPSGHKEKESLLKALDSKEEEASEQMRRARILRESELAQEKAGAQQGSALSAPGALIDSQSCTETQTPEEQREGPERPGSRTDSHRLRSRISTQLHRSKSVLAAGDSSMILDETGTLFSFGWAGGSSALGHERPAVSSRREKGLETYYVAVPTRVVGFGSKRVMEVSAGE